MEAFLESKIYEEHLRRLSNHVATVVDSLSRNATTTPELLSELAGVPWVEPKGRLLTWLENPLLDWDLPLKLVEDVKTLIEKVSEQTKKKKKKKTPINHTLSRTGKNGIRAANW